MWGIRAIRVGVFLAGLLVTITGCRIPSPNFPLIPSENQSIVPRDLGSQEDSGEQKSDTREVPPASDTIPPGLSRTMPEWRRGGFFQDQPQHLTPDKIHGGIY